MPYFVTHLYRYVINVNKNIVIILEHFTSTVSRWIAAEITLIIIFPELCTEMHIILIDFYIIM